MIKQNNVVHLSNCKIPNALREKYYSVNNWGAII